jgi:RNA polymerase sigma factor (sigma-70 family)
LKKHNIQALEKSKGQAEIIRLYDEASPDLLRLLRYKLGNYQEAEEVVQDAFEKLCKLADKNDIKDFRKYFFTMGNHMALNVLRRRNVENDYLSALGSLSALGNGATNDSRAAFNPETITRHKEKLHLVRSALQKLPHKTRHVFLLHRFEGFTYPEIAEQLGLSRKSIEYHMSRALTAVVESSEGA